MLYQSLLSVFAAFSARSSQPLPCIVMKLACSGMKCASNAPVRRKRLKRPFSAPRRALLKAARRMPRRAWAASSSPLYFANKALKRQRQARIANRAGVASVSGGGAARKSSRGRCLASRSREARAKSCIAENNRRKSSHRAGLARR